MKKILITFMLLTTMFVACSKSGSTTTKMDPKPAAANTGAQITSPDFNDTQK